MFAARIISPTNRGAAAAATRMVLRRIAAPPRPRRGWFSDESRRGRGRDADGFPTNRGDTAAAMGTFRGDERRGDGDDADVETRRRYPLDIFVNYEKMPQVRCPTAIIHGLSDTIVPDRCGKALHKLAPNPFEACWLEGYGHNDMPYDPLFMYAISFLATLKRDPPAYAGSSRGVNV